MAQTDTECFLSRRRKSAFVRQRGPAPKGLVCPDHYLLAHANGCPYSCDYCYLQLTFRHLEAPTVFTNRNDLVRDVREFLLTKEPAVLNAGKLCDGLAFDPATGLSKALVPLFAAQDRHKLLFLTKSTNVQSLLAIPDHRNTVVAFSVNAPALAARFERAAPSPFERIEAARACQDAGYEVRLKIDPVIPVPGWREHYLPLAERILERLDTARTRITVGSMRHFRPLPRYARAKGRDAAVFDVATSADGPDGRLRVPRDIRVEAYTWFREQFPSDVSVAVCKEPVGTWRELGWEPGSLRCNCTL